MGVVHFIVQEILSQPAYLVGIMALVGLLALRKPAGAVLSGTLKTVLGFLILACGAALVVTTLEPLSAMVQAVFHAHGVVPSNEAIVSVATRSLGRDISAIMAMGFVVNLLLARITPAKYVFLAGHLLLYMASVLAIVMESAGITGVHCMVLGSILLGAWSTSVPALLQPLTRKVTGGADFAIGHANSTGFLVAALVGRLVGKGSEPSGKTQLRGQGSFLQEPAVTTSLVMVVLYVVLALLAGPAVLQKYDGGGNGVMYALKEGLTFGASVAIIMYGVQMMVEELVPAFRGIGARLIPNAMPALDCPAVFPYAPASMLIGFLCSVAGGVAGMFLVRAWGTTLVIPGLVAQFFDGGAAGIYGNATGGRRGAILGSFVNGILITILPALLLPFLGTFQQTNTTFADTDFCWAGLLSGTLSRAGLAAVYAGIIGFSVLLIVAASFVTVRFRSKTA